VAPLFHRAARPQQLRNLGDPPSAARNRRDARLCRICPGMAGGSTPARVLWRKHTEHKHGSGAGVTTLSERSPRASALTPAHAQPRRCATRAGPTAQSPDPARAAPRAPRDAVRTRHARGAPGGRACSTTRTCGSSPARQWSAASPLVRHTPHWHSRLSARAPVATVPAATPPPPPSPPRAAPPGLASRSGCRVGLPTAPRTLAPHPARRRGCDQALRQPRPAAWAGLAQLPVCATPLQQSVSLSLLRLRRRRQGGARPTDGRRAGSPALSSAPAGEELAAGGVAAPAGGVSQTTSRRTDTSGPAPRRPSMADCRPLRPAQPHEGEAPQSAPPCSSPRQPPARAPTGSACARAAHGAPARQLRPRWQRHPVPKRASSAGAVGKRGVWLQEKRARCAPRCCMLAPRRLPF